MQVTVKSTDNFQQFQGRFYRMWRGHDSKGQEIVLWVLGMNYKPGSDMSEAHNDLRTAPMTGLEMTHVCTSKDVSGTGS